MRGKQIYIRILEKEDVHRTQQWISNPEISDIMGYLPVFDLSHQHDWFERTTKKDSSYVFAICLNGTNEHIGNIGLGNINYVHRHAMLNVFIAKDEHKGKGIGSEAVLLLLDFAFNRLNMHKIFLQTSERFTAANRMYISLGFSKDGVLREHYYTHGKYEDKILYSILKKEYQNRNKHEE